MSCIRGCLTCICKGLQYALSSMQWKHDRATFVRLLDNTEGLQVGRQAVAGCNPFTIQIATPAFLDPKKRAVTDGDVASK